MTKVDLRQDANTINTQYKIKFRVSKLLECKIFYLVLRKLKRLNLGGNDLTAVPQKALALLENLKKLEMQENRIASISEGDFAGMPLNISKGLFSIFLSLSICIEV